jgi:uncharacterized cupredoxin-like copper-binding protein
MAEQPSTPATRDRPATPRWVKLLGVAAIVLILLVVAVMLPSGGTHGPGLHAPTTSVGGGQPSPSVGSSAGGNIGGPAEADHATRTVEVATLDSMAFEPGAIDVTAGEVVTFVVTNSGQTAHEFTLGDAALQQAHADAMAHMLSGMAHGLPNSITLQPGETKRLTWRFGHAGALEYGCHEAGHYDAGMRGRITVS